MLSACTAHVRYLRSILLLKFHLLSIDACSFTVHVLSLVATERKKMTKNGNETPNAFHATNIFNIRYAPKEKAALKAKR